MVAKVEMFPCRSDNYGYLLHDDETGATASIDAPEEKAIVAALKRTGWRLTDILVTHHHADHTEAIEVLKASYGARVIGPTNEATKIKGLDELVDGGNKIRLGNLVLEVIDVPGHTLGHIAYYCAAEELLFSADALFSLGCGRMFEGTPQPMWEGLKRLRALPDATRIYCGHEYSLANAKFALSIDGANEALVKRAAEVEELRAAGKPTIPALLGEEKLANPFLRADAKGMAAKMGLAPGTPDFEVFAAIRKAKDDFKG